MRLLLLVDEDSVLQTVLEEDLALLRVHWEALGEFKESTISLEMNFENDWHLVNFLIHECEIDGHFTIFACAGVPWKVYFRPNVVFFDFGGTKLDPSVQLGDFGCFLFGSILRGAVKNEA